MTYFLKKYDFNTWLYVQDNEKSDNWTLKDEKEIDDIQPMSLLECNEVEVNEGKWLKILTLNKLLTLIPVLLPQIKARNNSYKLNKFRQILYLLYRCNEIT